MESEPERESNNSSQGSHGGWLRAAALEFGLPETTFLDFSANVNPLGLPAPVKKALKRELATVVHYPDPQCQELMEKLAAYHRVDPETLLVGNGAAELIYLLAQGNCFWKNIDSRSHILRIRTSSEGLCRPSNSVSYERRPRIPTGFGTFNSGAWRCISGIFMPT